MELSLLLVLAWNDYFYSAYNNYRKDIVTTNINSGAMDSYYVKNSFISNFKGGAIKMDGWNEVYLLVEDSTFASCSNTNHGGALYLYAYSDGNVVFDRVCAYECYTSHNYNGHLCRCDVGYDAPGYNLFRYVSISQCTPQYSSTVVTSGPMNLESGNPTLENTNSSYNKCYQGSAMSIVGRYTGSYIHHCSFNNNTGHQNSLYYHEGLHEICFSNIVNNYLYTSSSTVYFYDEYYGMELKITSCVFLNNEGSQYDVCTNGKPIIVTNCISSQSLRTSGDVTVTGTTISTSTHYLPHIHIVSKYDCYMYWMKTYLPQMTIFSQIHSTDYFILMFCSFVVMLI